MSDIFSVAAAVMVSLGGAGGIIGLFSGWLGKVWASRIMEREKAELSKSIEHHKAELTRSIEREKAEWAKFHEEHKSELLELSSQRQDALNRKREIYTQLATTMRVLLKANNQQEDGKQKFLKAYDEGYLWSSESVITVIRNLIEIMEKKAQADRNLSMLLPNAPGFEQASSVVQVIDTQAQQLYQKCMLAMRKDAGFADSTAEYRLVTFG